MLLKVVVAATAPKEGANGNLLEGRSVAGFLGDPGGSGKLLDDARSQPPDVAQPPKLEQLQQSS